MKEVDRAYMDFTIKGKRYNLDRSNVETRLNGVTPEPVRLHSVVVNGKAFPVKQALSIVLDIDRLSFTTAQARDVFSRLGFELIRQK